MNTRYSEAAVEVLDILDHTAEKDVKKISQKFIDFLKEQSSKTYKSTLDHTKTIKEMNLRPETQALLGIIYLNFWADEKGKEEFKSRLKENEIKYQAELHEKYNPDKLFENKEIIQKDKIDNEKLPTVMQKETFIKKIINKIKNFFWR